MFRQQIICFWIEGGDIATLLLESWGQLATIDVIDARERNYYSALDELVTCLKKNIMLSTPEMTSLPAQAFSWEPRNPYKGLKAFTQDDTGDFFGRDALVYELVDTVREMLAGNVPRLSWDRTLAVVRASGSSHACAGTAGSTTHLPKKSLLWHAS